MTDHQFDATNEEGLGTPKDASQEQARRFLGVHFACCEVYWRIYINRAGDAYQGNCPRCGKPLRIGIRAGGVADRFFTSY